MKEFFVLPKRAVKPREDGLTMVLDNGYSNSFIRGYLQMNAHLIDYVKIGWGTAFVTKDIEQKLALYKEFDIPVSLGGTFFELALLQDKVSQIEELLQSYEITMLEISNGTIEIEQKQKLQFISDFAAKGIKVISEVGSKDTKTVMAPTKWVEAMKTELNAGAWKVIAEGRESGTAGLYRGSQELRTGLVDEISSALDTSKIIWEAPLKKHQVWFIKQFGSDVNLGNIAIEQIIALETLRLGLRGDTLPHFHQNNGMQ